MVAVNQGPKYKLNWAQNTVLMAQGTFIGEEYRFCPVGYKAHKKFGRNEFRMKDNGDGTMSCETLCERCKEWKILDKAPTQTYGRINYTKMENQFYIRHRLSPHTSIKIKMIVFNYEYHILKAIKG